MRKKWQNLPLKLRMMSLLVVGWLIPIAIISIVMTVSVSSRLDGKMQENVSISMARAVASVGEGLEEVRRTSRNATYFGVVKAQYDEYVRTFDSQALYDSISLYLAQQYRYDPLLEGAIIFLTKEPERFYSTYSSGTAYNNISRFEAEHLPEVLEISKELDTGMMLYEAEDSLYLIRNLVDSSYRPYAMIALEINKDMVFGQMDSVWGYEKAGIYLDGKLIYGEDIEAVAAKAGHTSREGVVIIRHHGDYAAYSTVNEDIGNLTFAVELNDDLIHSEQRVGYYVLILVVISVIPLALVVFSFFDKMVSKPVEELVKAADEISKENYGYSISTDGGSRDLNYLNQAFNEMSAKLKTQFETIYLEELAVRDANIKALQSQINPHFINNTLEIINWEARLNGVYKVSAMIEALSTMLNATLNRKNDLTISLSEELEYVDAYLYVISERMGSRLEIRKEIDESLLKESIPRLIAQPIVENAVEHGIKTSASGYIVIRIYARNEYMFIEIRNSGIMSDEDKATVERLLSEENTGNERAVNVGIKNVNRRLKLMYGDTCGLTIKNEGDETVNLLTFKREGYNEEDNVGGTVDSTDSDCSLRR